MEVSRDTEIQKVGKFLAPYLQTSFAVEGLEGFNIKCYFMVAGLKRLKSANLRLFVHDGSRIRWTLDLKPACSICGPPKHPHFLLHPFKNGCLNMTRYVRLVSDSLTATLAFGIPSISRQYHSYLIETIQSLLQGLSDDDKEDVVIIAFIGDVSRCISQIFYLKVGVANRS